MAIYSEKRKYERFALVLPCLLSLNEDGVLSETVEIETRNICAGGVFLEVSQKNGFGDSAQVDILIPPHIIKYTQCGCTHISTSGPIVRRESSGIVVSFYRDYRIAPLDDVLRCMKKKVDWLAKQKDLIDRCDQSNLLHFSGRKRAHDHQKQLLGKF